MLVFRYKNVLMDDMGLLKLIEILNLVHIIHLGYTGHINGYNF